MKQETSTVHEQHRSTISKVIGESSFESILDLVAEEAMKRSGTPSRRPTVKQKRYRELTMVLMVTIDIATIQRV